MFVSIPAVLGFLALAMATPVAPSNSTTLEPPVHRASRGPRASVPSASNDTGTLGPLSNSSALPPLPFLHNGTRASGALPSNDTRKPTPTAGNSTAGLGPFYTINGTRLSEPPSSSSTLVLCNDFELSGPCSYTALPRTGTNCTHVPGLHHAPDSTKPSFISSIQMPAGYTCHFQSGTAGCVGHGSARALRLVGPVYHDCRPEWDNQITHFDCKPI